ncbi:uncharacterized protein [Anoplolepis gracilipes]|uniref:uncharacterized protein n=1 Tax=Anoplolepis gracilipes TaxID=354296 RepID=UPI003BA2ACED
MAVTGAYKSKRDISFFNADITSHRKPCSRNFFFDQSQSFIDKTIEQQTPPIRAVRDQTINQQALHYLPLKDHIIYPPEFPILRNQPFRQNSFTITSFRDKPLYTDVILKNQELRGEREVLKDNPFIGQSLTSKEIFERQFPTYKSQTPFKEQLFTTERPFKNLHYEQLPSSEQISSLKQPTFVEFPSISNSIKFDQDESYNKLINLYGRHKNVQTSSNKGFSMYTKYDDHAFKLPSMPAVSFSKHLSPLNIKMSSTSPSAIIHGSDFSMSSFPSSIGKIYSLEAVKMKLRPTPLPESTTSLPGSNCTSIDSSSTTIPSISVSTNQSSIVGHILTSLTNKPSSSVMDTATSIAPFVRNTLGPIQFYATKHGAVLTSSLPTQNELNNNIHAHLFMKMPKNNSFKNNEHPLKFQISETLKDNLKTSTQNPMLNYILSEEHKRGFKDIQNSFTNYALPEGFKYGWPLQQFSQPETLFAPLSLNGKTNFVLSNISAIPISIISWPMEISSDFTTMLPLKSVASNTATNNNLPLNMKLPSDFMASIPNNLTPTISNSISESITGSISTGIPSGMMADMPASIPTLNLGQSLHRVEQQLRQTQEARNPWYPTDLQLQLDGFGGINYTLHTGNPATRPMELGITKAGLTSPKLPQPHAPAFVKVSSQHDCKFRDTILMPLKNLLNNDT